MVEHSLSQKFIEEAPSLVHVLQARASTQPDRICIWFLEDGENETAVLTYGDLDRRARMIAAQIQLVSEPGQRVLLVFQPGIDFIVSLVGCFYAKAVGIPAYPPRANRNLERLQSIVEDAGAEVVLTSGVTFQNMRPQIALTPGLEKVRWIEVDKLDSEMADDWMEPRISAQDLAFLQYTSGSTGAPKGVMLSHGNVMANMRMITKAFEFNENSIMVSWLPVFHDMGLIGNILQPLYLGFPAVFMPPVAFLERPMRWLEAVTKYRGTVIGAPNFAFDLCVKRVKADDIARIDLSSLQLIYCGAEPIRVETLERFAASFAAAGLKRENLYPCYGMAEATLLVSGGKLGQGFKFIDIDKGSYEQGNIAFVEMESNKSIRLVSCGKTILDQKIQIVDPETLTPCHEGRVGEIWVAGRNVATGYWNKEELTQSGFKARLSDSGTGPFLRTGDLGFLHEGELYVSGRLKDLIIIGGKNHYPQDIELTVEKSHPAIRSGCTAAFAVEGRSTDELVVVAEIERTQRNSDPQEILEAVQRAVGEAHELRISTLTLLKTGAIFKTSSGKIQRRAMRNAFMENKLNPVFSWPSEQVEALNAEKAELSTKQNDGAEPSDDDSRVADELIAWLRNYAETRIHSRLIDERRCIPPYIVLDFGNKGLFGLQVPKAYGGLELSTSSMMRIVEQLSAIDLTLAIFVGLSNTLGVTPLLRSENAQLKEEFLPQIAKGRTLASFALTEPTAGSNPMAMSTRATRTSDQTWDLHGEKIWIGSASWAGVLSVIAKVYDADGNSEGFTCFAVRQGANGLRHGPEALTMGLRGMVQNQVLLEGVNVHQSDILGRPGEGMALASHTMNFARSGLAAICVGGIKRCLQMMMGYAGSRLIGTGLHSDNAATRLKFRHLTAAAATLELMVEQVAAFLDSGKEVPLELSLACKITGPELLWDAADTLVQILGGRGYVETNRAPQILRDARLLRIFEGPTETLEMHLGSTVVHAPEPVRGVIVDVFASPSVFEILERDRRALDENLMTTVHDRQLFHTVVGQMTAAAILYAVASKGVREGKINHYVERWAVERYHHILEKGKLNFVGIRDTAEIEFQSVIDSYQKTIGYVEQQAAGEDLELDRLLRRPKAQATQPGLKILEHLPARSAAEAPRNAPAIEPRRPGPVTQAPSPKKAEPEKKNPSVPAKEIVPEKRISDANGVRKDEIILNLVSWLSKELKIPAEKIDTRKPVTSYGLDSVAAVELVGYIEDWLGFKVTQSMVWDYPTLDAIAGYLYDKATMKK